MSAAASSLLHDIGIPKMVVRKMSGTVHQGNDASMKIYEKLGFKIVEDSESVAVEGVQRPLSVYKWEYKA